MTKTDDLHRQVEGQLRFLANAGILDGWSRTRREKEKWDIGPAIKWQLWAPGFNLELNTTQVRLWISGALTAYRVMEGTHV